MKLTIARDDLAKAAVWAARALQDRPTAPVLTRMLLTASDGRLTLAAYDYEVSATMTATADVAEPGEILVPGRLLGAIVKQFPDRPVELASDGTRLEVRCGAARFTLQLLPAEDYPALPELPPLAGRIGAATFGTLGEVLSSGPSTPMARRRSTAASRCSAPAIRCLLMPSTSAPLRGHRRGSCGTCSKCSAKGPCHE